MKRRSTGRVRLWFGVGSLVLAVAATVASTALASTHVAGAKPAVKPYTAAQWRAQIGRAQAEGSVTV